MEQETVSHKERKRLGLAPAHATEGDVVTLLWGCSLPVVLRKLVDMEWNEEEVKESSEWELVGEIWMG